MMTNEKELINKIGSQLVEKYGYSPNEIEYEVKFLEINYRADIVIYKDSLPFIVLEVKSNYSHKIFVEDYENLHHLALAQKIPYFGLVTDNYIEVYKIIDDDAIAISDIPAKNNQVNEEYIVKLSDEEVRYRFNEIRNILWYGGKRDDYTIINEINKILLCKIYDEINKVRLNRFKIYDHNQTEEIIKSLFDEANSKYKVFKIDEKLNLDSKEIEIIVRLLEHIILLNIDKINKIYFSVFIDILKGEVFLYDEILDFFKNIIINKNSILCPNSGFGQIPLSLELDIDTIEINQIKYQTNFILVLIQQNKNYNKGVYLGDFLNIDILKEHSYDTILTVPPFGVKSKDYPAYEIDRKSSKDVFVLYIERSLMLLNNDGLLYIVVPDGLLSNSSSSHIRDYIRHHFDIVSIISFSSNIFINASIKASLLILRKSGKRTFNTLLLEIKTSDYINYSEKIKDFIKHRKSSDDTIKQEDLLDRLDVNYYEKKYLELEAKIKDRGGKPLSEYVEIIRGGSLRHDKFGTELLITAGSIKHGAISNDDLSRVTSLDYNQNTRGIVQENDLLIKAVGKPECAKVTKHFEGANTNASIIILRPIKKSNADKLCDYLNSNIAQRLLNRRKIPTLTATITTQTELQNILILLDNYDDLLEADVDEKPITRLEKIMDTFEAIQTVLPDENESTISLTGINGQVFGLNVIRSFVSLENLKYFKTDKQNYQRNIDVEHEKELVEYLTNKDYKFFPEIVMAIKDKNILEKKGLFQIYNLEGCLDLIRLYFYVNDNGSVFDDIKILDGRHRIESLKKYLKDDPSKSKLTVSVVFILLSEEDTSNLVDRAIFYNLNARMKPLLPIDYLNLLHSDKENTLNGLGIVNIDIFKILAERKYDLFKSINSEDDMLEKCISLTDTIVKYSKKDQLTKKYIDVIIDLLKNLKENLLISYDITYKINFYNLIVFIWLEDIKEGRNQQYIEKEIKGFLEWINISGLEETIKNVDDLKDFYKTYQTTYVPKSRKIYLSMPYHKETEWTYFLVKDIINKISKNLKMDVKIIRTDKESNGVHSGIREKVYREIEESDLLIADLTGNNPNVFNEVGFKMGLDKAKGLHEPQIIFVVNTKSYYEEFLDKTKDTDCSFSVNGKIWKNSSEKVAFNLSSIKQITFYESHYLEVELYKELETYFQFYKIQKRSTK